MTRLYHLVLKGDLEVAADDGQIAPGPEGFVHLSADHQVTGTVDRFYADVPPGELVVLELETDRLSAVVWEEGEPGVEFPHLYAPIALDTVAAVRIWSPELGATLLDDAP